MNKEQKRYVEAFLRGEVDRQCTIIENSKAGSSKHVAALWRRDALVAAVMLVTPDLTLAPETSA